MLRRLRDALLAVAARGWPVQRRADLVREWKAELYALDLEPGRPGPVRAGRRLWFVVSLVLARLAHPVGPSGLSRRLSDVESNVFHAVALAAAPVVAAVPAMVGLGPFVLFFVRLTPTTATLLLLARWAVGATTGAVVGTALARRLVERRFGRPLGWPGRLLALVPLLAGMIVVDILTRGADVAADAGTGFVLTGGLALLPLLVLVAVLMARGSRRSARVVAVAGAPAVVFVATAVVAWLAPLQPIAAERSPWWWLPRLNDISLPYDAKTSEPHGLPVEHVLPLLPGVLLTTVALALAHLLRASRPLPRDAMVPADEVAPVAARPVAAPVARWWVPTMLAGAVYCLVAWAVTLTYLSRNIGAQAPWSDSLQREVVGGWPQWNTQEGRLWMQDMQLYTIAAAALFLLCAAAFRGAPVLPVLLGALLLVVADTVVIRAHLLAPRTLPWLVGGGLLAGMAVWWVAARLGRSSSSWLRRRRLVTLVTVLAAYLAPVAYFGKIFQEPGAPTPPVLLLVTVGVPTLLAALAAVGVVTTTTLRVPGPIWAAPLAVAAVSTVVGVFLWNEALWPMDPGSPAGTTLRLAAALISASLPLSWVALAVGLIRGRARLLRRPALLVLAGLGLIPVGFVISYLSVFGSMIIGGILLRPMTYGQTGDGIPFVPGAFLVGLGAAVIATIDLARPVPVAAPGQVA